VCCRFILLGRCWHAHTDRIASFRTARSPAAIANVNGAPTSAVYSGSIRPEVYVYGWARAANCNQTEFVLARRVERPRAQRAAPRGCTCFSCRLTRRSRAQGPSMSAEVGVACSITVDTDSGIRSINALNAAAVLAVEMACRAHGKRPAWLPQPNSLPRLLLSAAASTSERSSPKVRALAAELGLGRKNPQRRPYRCEPDKQKRPPPERKQPTTAQCAGVFSTAPESEPVISRGIAYLSTDGNRAATCCGKMGVSLGLGEDDRGVLGSASGAQRRCEGRRRGHDSRRAATSVGLWPTSELCTSGAQITLALRYQSCSPSPKWAVCLSAPHDW